MTAPTQPPSEGKYRPLEGKYRIEREPCSGEFGSELARITGDIDDPILKLKYLRGVIDQGQAAPVDLLPCAPARRALYRWRSLEALHRALRNDTEANASVIERVHTARQAARRSIAGIAAAALFLVPAMLAGVVVNIGETVEIADTKSSSVAVASTSVAEPSTLEAQHAPAPALPVAETLPPEELGMLPTTIWLADKGPGWELYSNGLRVETSYAVSGKERHYSVYHRERGVQRGVHSKPVGIVFHTSESDLWPLEENYERELRRSSASLLRYVQRVQAYNYLIDRFGRVYRVVEDETRANHAGRGIWARDEEVFLDLNSAFLGVSFESRWDGGRTLPITRAQLIAGRNLTHYLRQRFAIAPEMCVTHGLTSVNAKRKLIGYHLDWARGFPFEAFGLPDLYARPTPSVALFGFRYDDDFLNTVGERWPGLIAAEQLLAEEAAARSVTIDQVRRERQLLYQEWSKAAPDDANVARESPTPRSDDKRG